MAGFMDDMQDKMSDLKARYEELKSKEQAGELDDQGREELNSLRERIER